MITKLGYFSLEKRNLMILFFIFFIPTLFLCYFAITDLFSYKKLQADIESIEKIASYSVDQRKRRFDFLTNHMNANANYLDDLSLSKEFLIKERKNLEKIDCYKVFREDLDVQKRKEFLLSKNKLFFQKDQTKKKENIQETRYILKNKVEGSLEDIESLLFDLELKKEIPQHVLYDFQMNLISQNVYSFNLLILQREFLK